MLSEKKFSFERHKSSETFAAPTGSFSKVVVGFKEFFMFLCRIYKSPGVLVNDYSLCMLHGYT